MCNPSNGRGRGAYAERIGNMNLFGKKKTVSTVNVKTVTTTTVNTGIASPGNLTNNHQKAAETGTIYNLIILDESGSMDSIYGQALSGANETLNTIRLSQKEDSSLVQILTFVTFDSGSNRPDVREIISLKPISEVKDLTVDDYRPSGCTPLYDAMGISIKKLVEHVKEGDHVLVTVITEGYENSSRHYSASMVKEMVESLRAKGWVFTYIGANQDSVEVAGGLGIHNAMDFAQDATGAQMMWEKMNSGRREFYKKASRMRMTMWEQRQWISQSAWRWLEVQKLEIMLRMLKAIITERRFIPETNIWMSCRVRREPKKQARLGKAAYLPR